MFIRLYKYCINKGFIHSHPQSYTDIQLLSTYIPNIIHMEKFEKTIHIKIEQTYQDIHRHNVCNCV